MNSIAVVTAVAGDYDYVGSHKGYRDDVDYWFFTDGRSEPLDGEWRVARLPERYLQPRKAAKIPKLAPHVLPELWDYQHIIWIDGSMQIQKAYFVDELLSHLHNGMLLSPHFDGRDCGYGEATIRPGKYASEPLDEQVAYYHHDGFPEHFGLWECGLNARDITNPKVREFGDRWLAENLLWSSQDQVSCGYSLWKTGLVPDVLPKSWREYDWIHINAHKREE